MKQLESLKFEHVYLCCVQRYLDAGGERREHGSSGLKQTEQYTPEFGRGLATWWTVHKPIASGTAVLAVVFFCFDRQKSKECRTKVNSRYEAYVHMTLAFFSLQEGKASLVHVAKLSLVDARNQGPGLHETWQNSCMREVFLARTRLSHTVLLSTLTLQKAVWWKLCKS